jgi:hypothetical protein
MKFNLNLKNTEEQAQHDLGFRWRHWYNKCPTIPPVTLFRVNLTEKSCPSEFVVAFDWAFIVRMLKVISTAENTKSQLN